MSANVFFRPKVSLNRKWKNFNQKQVITLIYEPIVNPGCRVFTMGSCFATEIRKVLRTQNFQIYPDYPSIHYDPGQAHIGSLASSDYLNHYHTFAICQEFERAVGLWKPEENDFWTIPDQWFGGEVCYQDPYRRFVVAKTPQLLQKITADIDARIEIGIRSSEIFLITLGLVEVWRNIASDRFACANPGYMWGGGVQETEFHMSTFQENYLNLQKIVEIIKTVNEDAKIVFTVSPVPVGTSFEGNDVFVANMEGKSILRAVAGQVSRTNRDVDYFPSYEICSAIRDVYTEDGRHVRPEIINGIVGAFTHSYVRPLEPSGPSASAQPPALTAVNG